SETVPEKCRVGWFGRRRGTVRKRSGPDEYVSSWGTTEHARTRSARATRGSRWTCDDKDDHAHDLLHSPGGFRGHHHTGVAAFHAVSFPPARHRSRKVQLHHPRFGGTPAGIHHGRSEAPAFRL